MSRINAIDPTEAQGKNKELFAAVDKMLGATPNLFRVAGNAPSALEAMVHFFGAAARSSLPAKVREQIALTVAQVNGCDYCLSAHSYLGEKVGLSRDDMAAARDAASADPKTAAILRFARELVLQRGRVELESLRAAGVTDQQAIDVVAIVVLNIFTNYVNLVAGTDIDFPIVRAH